MRNPGIFCNAARTHVIEVFPNPRDSGNTLQGVLPPSFWTDLPELEHVYLSNDRPPGPSFVHSTRRYPLVWRKGV